VGPPQYAPPSANIFRTLKVQHILCRFFDCPLLVIFGLFRNCLKSLDLEGNTCVCIFTVNWFNFWHFTSIFVNLFVRWRYQLLTSLRSPVAVGFASKLKLCLLVTLLPWPLTFSHLNGSRVTCVMGFLPANFQLAAPFRDSRLRVRHVTDRRTDNGHQRLMLPPYGTGA